MGGWISAVLGGDDLLTAGDARADALLARIAAWARPLTRHDPASALSRLNATAEPEVDVPPTLAACLHAAATARRLTGGLVDAGVLAARLNAEAGLPAIPAGEWRITGRTVHRPAGAGLVLDGVAKGWLAERALRLPAIAPLPVALVACDGDIAVRSSGGIAFDIRIEDPRDPDPVPGTLEPIGLIRLPLGRRVRAGIATSGTYRHTWGGRGHIVEPATGEPARSGVVSATVIAPDAVAAEALAKAVVLRGAAAAPLLRAAGATAIAVTDRDTQLRFPGLDQWMDA